MFRRPFLLVSIVLPGLCPASGCSRDAAAPVPPAAPSAASPGGVPEAGAPPVSRGLPSSEAEQTPEGTQAPDEPPHLAATQKPGEPSAAAPATTQAEMEAYLEPTGEEVYPNAEAQLDISDLLA